MQTHDDSTRAFSLSPPHFLHALANTHRPARMQSSKARRPGSSLVMASTHGRHRSGGRGCSPPTDTIVVYSLPLHTKAKNCMYKMHSAVKVVLVPIRPKHIPFTHPVWINIAQEIHMWVKKGKKKKQWPLFYVLTYNEKSPMPWIKG